MRDIGMTLRRVQVGLPITDEERQAAMEHLKLHKERQERFGNRVFLVMVLLVAILGVAAYFK